MIIDGEFGTVDTAVSSEFDLFVYGLGFETRSTMLASKISSSNTVAVRMVRIPRFKYDANVRFAKSRGHSVIRDVDDYQGAIAKSIRRSKDPINIGVDVSSMNRTIIFDVLRVIARSVRDGDDVKIFYCPSEFSEPEIGFPQIERLGPISKIYSSFDDDPTKPLCLILGLGFEPGVSMGIISQLEPKASFCFWGTGVDERFDDAVRRSNFDFDFDFVGFNTRSVDYKIGDPLGSYQMLESLTYGLTRTYNVIFVPMGPKIFSVLSAAVYMSYVGRVAVWRVQHNPVTLPDAQPGNKVVMAHLGTDMLRDFAARECELFGGRLYN